MATITELLGGRRCGVLLHPTALPGPDGCGSFGSRAHAWVDALADQGIAVWQILPLTPPDPTGSPYSSPSSFAIHPGFLDLERLVEEGLLGGEQRDAIRAASDAPADGRDPAAQRWRVGRKVALLGRALGQAQGECWSGDERRLFERWRQRQRGWLEDYALFVVIKEQHQGCPWWQWPPGLAQRHRSALRRFAGEHRRALLEQALLQWLVERQWLALLSHARQRGLSIFGDLPFYVAHDSADVWARRHLFTLKADGGLQQQSGVPPDYFSATGQLWATPVYRWWLHRLTAYGWWMDRLQRQYALMDLLRLDHFRALESYWSVPGGDATAQRGRWCPSPGSALLQRLRLRRGGSLPLVAEDLGVITPAVETLRRSFGLAGMKILQFAFGDHAGNPYLPHNYSDCNWVVYTGTHDNATSLGWWQQLDEGQRQRVRHYIGGDVDRAPGWALVRLALASVAGLAIVPLQDLLCLDDHARFNTPATVGNNWCWRIGADEAHIRDALAGYGGLADQFGRRAGGPC